MHVAQSLSRTADAARRARRRRRFTVTIAALAALALCAPAAATAAAGSPQILAAGVDATDHLFVTWSLEPGTTFDFLEFSTVAISNPFIPGSFAGRNVIASACVTPGDGCTAPPLLKAFRSVDPVARDRRYFVKVNARRGSGRPLSSKIWVVDRARPILPGGGRPSATPTNRPVLGEPYKPPNKKTIPPPTLVLRSPPKTIASVIKNGVRADVTCPEFVCYAVVSLSLGKTTLVFSDTTARPDTREAFVLRPRPIRRANLRRRTKARLVVTAEVTEPGGKQTQLSRRFTVKR
jgi:hypothetical protein